MIPEPKMIPISFLLRGSHSAFISIGNGGMEIIFHEPFEILQQFERIHLISRTKFDLPKIPREEKAYEGEWMHISASSQDASSLIIWTRQNGARGTGDDSPNKSKRLMELYTKGQVILPEMLEACLLQSPTPKS